jgi:polyribonucleotide 5'-hydroxyl-kinase
LNILFSTLFIHIISGALLVERPSTVEEGFSQQAPLVYHYGHKTPGTNSPLYNTLVSRLAEVIQERMNSNKKGNLHTK